jgi:hypothetical protein
MPLLVSLKAWEKIERQTVKHNKATTKEVKFIEAHW